MQYDRAPEHSIANQQVWTGQLGEQNLKSASMTGPATLRLPTLSEQADGLIERSNMLHGLVSDLEVIGGRLINDRSNKASAAGGIAPPPTQPPSTVEDRLHMATSGLLTLESRIRSLLNKLSEGV